MKTFKVTYEILVQRDDAHELAVCAMTKDGYASVEALKDETKTVLETMIQEHEIPDDKLSCEMRISAVEDGEETYYDHDEAVIRVENGKIVEFME